MKRAFVCVVGVTTLAASVGIGLGIASTPAALLNPNSVGASAVAAAYGLQTIPTLTSVGVAALEQQGLTPTIALTVVNQATVTLSTTTAPLSNVTAPAV